MDEWFESDNQRELRQIFQGQSHIFETLKNVNQKLDEVVGRQERTMSLISQQGGAVVPGSVPQDPGMHAGQIDSIRRHEVDAIFNNQNKIIGNAQEIRCAPQINEKRRKYRDFFFRQYVNDLKSKLDTILNNQVRQPTAQVQSVGYDTQSLISEMRDGLNHVKQNYAQVIQKLAEKQPCSTNCVSLLTVIIVVTVQMVLLLGYFFYR